MKFRWESLLAGRNAGRFPWGMKVVGYFLILFKAASCQLDSPPSFAEQPDQVARFICIESSITNFGSSLGVVGLDPPLLVVDISVLAYRSIIRSSILRRLTILYRHYCWDHSNISFRVVSNSCDSDFSVDFYISKSKVILAWQSMWGQKSYFDSELDSFAL